MDKTKGESSVAGKYSDIIHLDRPISKNHSPMPAEERAAQFSPFAALTGYEDVIQEAARLTASPIELDEDAKQELNRLIQVLSERIQREGNCLAEITWFEPDGLKLGGAYVTSMASVRRVDQTYRLLELEDRSVIEIDRILDLRLL